MAFPALAAIGLGSSLLGGLFGHRSEKKKAGEQYRAQQELLGQQRAGHAASESGRAAKGEAIQSFLQSLLGGRYALDPSAVQRILAPRPFVPQGPNVDPRVGMGSGFAGSLLSGLGGGLMNAAALRGAQPPTSPGAVGGFGGQPFRPQDIPGMGQPFGGR